MHAAGEPVKTIAETMGVGGDCLPRGSCRLTASQPGQLSYHPAMGTGLRGTSLGVLLAVGLILGVNGCARSMPDADRWAALPHTMGCEFDPGDTAPDGPLSSRVRAVTLSHPGEQRLRLDVEFLGSVPPPPRMINTRFGTTEAPGTIFTDFLIQPTGQAEGKVISVDTLGSDSREWRADTSEFDSKNWNILESASAGGNVLTFVLDLSPIEEALGRSKFQAEVDVVRNIGGQLNAAGIAEPFPVKALSCRWGIPAPSPSSRDAVPAPAPAPSTQASASAPDNNLHWGFQSPTGNIACDLSGTVSPAIASCEVREHTYQQQVQTGCDAAWANKFTIRQGGAVEFDCYPGSAYGSLPVGNYGHPLTVGSITCVLEESTGVTCTDATTGHSFQAARQEYHLS